MIFGCASCKKTYMSDSNIEYIGDYDYKCKLCGEPHSFQMDEGLALIMKHFWKHGYETLYGCSGHLVDKNHIDWYDHTTVAPADRCGYIFVKGELPKGIINRINKSKIVWLCKEVDNMPNEFHPYKTFTLRWKLPNGLNGMERLYQVTRFIKETIQ